MLTTLQQAKKLVTDRQFNVLVNHLGGAFDERPTIHEALEWFREVKGIHCSVNLYQDDSMKDCIYYVGCYKDSDVIRPIEMKITHYEAESALLDEVIKYVEE